MTMHNPIAEVELSIADINRMQRWYRAAVNNNRADISAEDIVLEARLRTIRTDMEDRVVVRSAAIRARSDVHRFQHPGIERRARNLTSIVPADSPRQRIKRPVTVTSH